MASVEFKKVVKAYGDIVIVPAMDLTIPDGKFTVLVGPSGCGKSTTLRMIAGLEEVTRGDLLIGDKRVNDVLPRDRNIAMVFQSYALYPHMTVRENMAFGLKLRKTPSKEISQRVKEASTLLGLDEYLERKPKALSGGQRQRVAMGRAIVRRPEVFLFDEPLSNLDAKLRGEMRREIAKLHQRLKTTIVYVTHDQVEAMTLADNIVVLERGRIRQMGRPLTLYHKPDNKFVASFIGSPTMNFFDMSIKEGKTLTGNGFSLAIPDKFHVGKAKEATLGIRPENLTATDSLDKPGTIECTVEVVEPLGAEILITGITSMGPIMASLPPTHEVEVGDKIPLAFPPDKIHLFDTTEDGASLRKEGE
ncbi:sn-glycerol-3-phosphate ABC transporter ATP-binding protein UgpC [Myxococcota bacterium]|nr:sn-glycerol-3-phosphate ABC transporter ATP-binding protein UgpC [Myxococcota bacterium]